MTIQKKLLDYGFAVAGKRIRTPAGSNTSVSDAANNSTSNSSNRPAIRPVQIPHLPATRVDRVALELAIQLLRATVRGSSLEMNGNT